MAVKVGSAGPMIESVIQYTQNNQNALRLENSEVNAGQEKNNGASRVETKKQISHSAGLSKLSDGITSSSERAQENRARMAERLPQTKAAVDKPVAGAVEAAVVETAGGEIVENRSEPELTQEAVRITVEDVNKKIANQGAEVAFSYHEKTGRYSFTVLDKATGEILREVPPEKSLDMVAKMFEMVGLIVDEKL